MEGVDDTQQFADWHAAMYRLVCGIARRYGFCEADAGDVVGKVEDNLMRESANFTVEPVEHAKYWRPIQGQPERYVALAARIAFLAKHRALELLRKQKLRRAGELPPELRAAELRARVRWEGAWSFCFDSLAEPGRGIFWLYHFIGIALDEIAELLNLPADMAGYGQIRGRLQRAREQWVDCVKRHKSTGGPAL